MHTPLSSREVAALKLGCASTLRPAGFVPRLCFVAQHNHRLRLSPGSLQATHSVFAEQEAILSRSSSPEQRLGGEAEAER